ncbi:GH18 domain-containing protein [Aphelenchoides fujianensis]|nr:GH18 domain-containing protein [Aphelenchoides fujianensis]
MHRLLLCSTFAFFSLSATSQSTSTDTPKRVSATSRARRLTHVIFAFLHLNHDGSLSFADVARQFPQLRVLFAIGGWENSEFFSLLVADGYRRKVLCDSILRIISRFELDGVDIDWEVVPDDRRGGRGTPADKENYVHFLRELRERFDRHQPQRRLLISFAGAAGQWSLEPGYDLPALPPLRRLHQRDVLRFVRIAGVIENEWIFHITSDLGLEIEVGRLHRPACPALLLDRQNLNKLNLGLAFYGRFWERVGDAVDSSDPMWRMARPNERGEFEGGHIAWKDLQTSDWNLNATSFHEKARTPWIFDSARSRFLGFENVQSLTEKVVYAGLKGLGGVMMWAVDQDDEQATLLDAVAETAARTRSNFSGDPFRCSPINEKRWWTMEDGEGLAGKCGKEAPLYNGFFPVCDPNDPGYACCSPWGYCGSGPEFCDCPTCVDYGRDPSLILKEPTRPTHPITTTPPHPQRKVTWWTFSQAPDHIGKCGPSAPRLPNGVIATCDPDSPAAYCCSREGYCGGIKNLYCDCVGCVNFKEHPDFTWENTTSGLL